MWGDGQDEFLHDGGEFEREDLRNRAVSELDEGEGFDFVVGVVVDGEQSLAIFCLEHFDVAVVHGVGDVLCLGYTKKYSRG